MSDNYADFATALSSVWRVVRGGEEVGGYAVEDDAIFTMDDEEVLCASEWLRVSDGVLDHIVAVHNATVDDE